MKKTITLLLSIAFCLPLLAQRVNYDTDSKWFFGVNAGGTWNSTDVNDKLYGGWGFIFGRQFNYGPGNRASFDLRLRYLGGLWYGQDYDTTMLANYNPAYMPAEYQAYKDGPGYTVNNHENEVHELGLELAIHANRLRERSGWDPYIFGGVNIAWNQTFSDLVNMDSSFFSTGIYDYSGVIDKAMINGTLDGDYETAMNVGSLGDRFNADFVPSLGFGIGYQVGPRFSVGLEHKTSWALKNDWDGYESSDMKLGIFKNDIYHYSNGYLRFHLGGGKVDPIVDETDCLTPAISFVRPATNGVEVDQQIYAFRANVSQIGDASSIQLLLNGVPVTDFVYSQGTQQIDANLSLVEGPNTIQITATNGCGQDVRSITINYVTCKQPVINITAPQYSNVTVDQAQFTITGTIENTSAGVSMVVNGMPTNNFYFNANNGTLQSNVTLREGTNTITVSATNECGTDTETFTIVYSDCDQPEVTFGVPNGMTVNSQSFNYSAEVQNVSVQSNIAVRINGTNKTFSYNATSKAVTGTISLVEGQNTIQITATNDCGTDTETITVIYQAPCAEPIVQMMSPIGTTQTESATTIVKAKVINVAASSQIVLKVNGVVVAGGTYSATTNLFQKTVDLQMGANTIEILATNNCGTQTQTVYVNRSTCELPTIAMITPASNNSTVESASLALQATVIGVSSTSQINLTVNGVNQSSGATYSSVNGLYRRSLVLQQGYNVIVVTATNDCGTVSETVTINYQPCSAPDVTMLTPLNGSSSVVNTALVKATVMNVENSNQITLIVNGSIVSGATYSTITHVFQKSVNLQVGLNTIQVKATTDCGTETETITVTVEQPCDLPTISLINPASATVTTQSGSLALQATVTGVASTSQINLTVNSVNQSSGASYSSVNGLYRRSLTLQQGVNIIVITATNDCGTVSATITVNFQPCIAPVVTMISPLNGSQAQGASALVKATVINVDGVNNIQLLVNGGVVSGGTFSNASHVFEKTVTLQPGVNTIQVIATTDCGTDTEALTVTFTVPCDPPTISVTNPSMNPFSTDNGSLALQATITGVQGAGNIQVSLNGTNQAAGSYTTGSGLYRKTLNLQNGANVIVITATNDCGTVTETIVVNYAPCLAPVVAMISPVNGLTSQSNTALVKATVTNVNNLNEIQLIVNGVVVTGGTYNAVTHLFERNVNLNVGSNTIQVLATTNCGTDTKSAIVTLDEPCENPTISITKPTDNNFTTDQANLAINAIIQGVTSGANIQLTVNGSVQAGGNYTTGTGLYRHTAILQEGPNVIVITATNDCGTVTATLNVNYVPCEPPSIVFITPTSGMQVTDGTLEVKATIENIGDLSQVQLLVNGVIIGGGTYNPSTKLYQNSVTLQIGLNQIQLTASTECGNDVVKVNVTRTEVNTDQGSDTIQNTHSIDGDGGIRPGSGGSGSGSGGGSGGGSIDTPAGTNEGGSIPVNGSGTININNEQGSGGTQNTNTIGGGTVRPGTGGNGGGNRTSQQGETEAKAKAQEEAKKKAAAAAKAQEEAKKKAEEEAKKKAAGEGLNDPVEEEEPAEIKKREGGGGRP